MKLSINAIDTLLSDDASEKYKAEQFDKISELFYCQNFGSANKSEIELLMFSILMDAMIEKYQNDDKSLDYNACSDYEIGKMLGIPQEKVRSLKVKKQARYPVSFDWYKSLMSMSDRIVYDEKRNKIIVPMPDPNLYNEIRNFIETQGGYIEIQRGKNCLQMRLEYFFMILYYKIDNEQEKETIRDKMTKELKTRNEMNEFDIKTDRELENALQFETNNLLDLLSTVLDAASPALGLLFKSIRTIGHTIRNEVKHNV